MSAAPSLDAAAQTLFSRLRSFCLPAGEDSARTVTAIRYRQRGEIRASAEAGWLPFTAEETIYATRSEFHWEARIGRNRLIAPLVVDAYENGHGLLTVKAGGVIPVKSARGPEVDKGEIQRYLASLLSCPPMLLLNRALEWSAAGASVLRVRDRTDATGAVVDIELAPDGSPMVFRAERPRMVGKQTIPTPWSARAVACEIYEGLRLARTLEAAWEPPGGSFVYYRGEVTAIELLR